MVFFILYVFSLNTVMLLFLLWYCIFSPFFVLVGGEKGRRASFCVGVCLCAMPLSVESVFTSVM